MSLIAPSILNSDFLLLGDTVQMLNESETDWIHLDVMDGSFVPNISFGIPIVEAVKKTAKKPLDVHLMIVNPEKYIEGFRQAGADIINIHYEACQQKNLKSILRTIRDTGARPALAIKPDTPVSAVFDYAEYIDMVLVMSVFPGFGGQQFMEESYERIARLRSFFNDNNMDTLIQVDGGVSPGNIARLKSAGADVMVVGSVIFKSASPSNTISELKSLVR
ncbi:MAG: ribulose-phosphate 3-epimerase [Cyclobacteriaceae bacterium]|nr:ribulose-phosphate 3-epimerase [Cyclobacteriaceae bacterium]